MAKGIVMAGQKRVFAQIAPAIHGFLDRR